MIVARGVKELGNLQYAEEVVEGKLDIIDVELDDDFNRVYGLVNGQLDNANIRDNAAIVYEKLNLVGKIKTTDLAAGFTIPATAIPPGSVTAAMLAPGGSYWDFGTAPPRFGDFIDIGASVGNIASNYLSIANMQARAAPMNFIITRLWLSGTALFGGSGGTITARLKRDNVGIVDITGSCPATAAANVDQTWTIYYDTAIAVPDTANHTYAVDILKLTTGLGAVRAGTFTMLAPA